MRFLKRARRWVGVAGLALMVAAISQEMSKPEDERTWHGELLGLIPYDFRPPTWERIREAYWDPASERILTPRVLGVGWGLNLARVADLMTAGFEFLMGSAGPSHRSATAPAARRSRRAR